MEFLYRKYDPDNDPCRGRVHIMQNSAVALFSNKCRGSVTYLLSTTAYGAANFPCIPGFAP